MASLGLKGRKVVVLGVNPSAPSLVRFLLNKGAVIKLVDPRKEESVLGFLADQIDLTKVTIECGDFQQKSFEEAEIIVVTPGLPMDLKILEAARTAGREVVSELEFVASAIEEPVIAIAGTNGKSTTAALLAAMLEADGKNVFTNATQPISNYLNLLVSRKRPEVVVLVANSFQLEGIKEFKPNMVVVTNISEDHMNRYPNFETYLAANREILRNADEKTTIILNANDAHVSSFAQLAKGRTIVFGNQEIPTEFEGAWANKNTVFFRVEASKEVITFPLNNFRLRGSHNRENLMAAGLAAITLGAKPESIGKVIETFAALPHRVEFLRRLNSVAFYNDSAAASPGALLRTLQAFTEPVILISGGRDKNADYAPLVPHIRQRVKNMILVGEAKEKMNRSIGDYTETFLVGTVEEAVLLAYQKSRSGDVVLFSPGADSTDAFASHEDRGETFRKLVAQLAQPRKSTML